MASQEAAAIVPLVEKETHGVALIEAQREAQPVFADGELLRCWHSPKALRRGAAFALQQFVIDRAGAEARRAGLDPFFLRDGQRRSGLGQQIFAEPVDVKPRPSIRRAVDYAERIRQSGIDDRRAQREPGII